jgi:phage/plasmid-like protein (TIGR03299 family)
MDAGADAPEEGMTVAHMIDETTGRPAIAYIGSTPWHGLGQRITGEAARDLDQLRVAAGLDWEVETRDIAYMSAEGVWTATAKGQANVRKDTNAVLGIVGPAYHCAQNAQVIDVFAPAVREFGLQPTVAGGLNGGSQCWLLAKLPESIDPTGNGDTVNGYALLRWGHDGTIGITAALTPVRVVCQNTMALAINGELAKLFKLRHTASVEGRLDQAAELVTGMTQALIATGETFATLAQRQLTAREVVAYIEAVFPQDGAKLSDTIKNRRATVADLLASGVGAELANPGGIPTAWGVYNAVTEYFDHVRPAEAKSAAGRKRANESAIFGGNADVKRFALAQARELVAA